MRPYSHGLATVLFIAHIGCSPESPLPTSEVGGATTWQDAPSDFEQDCPEHAQQGDGSCAGTSTAWRELYDTFFEQPETIANLAPDPDCDSLPGDLWAIRQLGEGWMTPFDWPEVGGPEGLGAALWEGVNMGWLLDSLPDRDLDVFVLSERQVESSEGVPYRELDLVLRDRFAGDVPALLLVPSGEGPFPGVLALPGHAEDAPYHVDNRFGARFPERGMALLAVSFRAYQQGDSVQGPHPESQAAHRFLCQGMSLMAMRAYEAALGLRALRSLDGMDPERIGVIGHSGGSTTAHFLLWRLDVDVHAWVLDNRPAHFDVDLMDPDDPSTVTLDCGVHPWADGATELLADVCMLPEEWERDVSRVPYAYSPGATPVEGERCATWPWEPAAEPGPDDPDAPEWFLPFFEQRLGVASAQTFPGQ